MLTKIIRRSKLVFILIIFLFSTFIQATNVPEYVKLHQPNGYIFTARGEGDEFLQRFKTIDDYTIIGSSDGWWYYASQGKDGKLYPTQYRVGTDDMEAMSSLTEDINYSQAVINAAQTARINFLNSLTIKSVAPKSIGVILVDFPDRIATRTNPNDPNNVMDTHIINNPANSNWSKRYTMNDFQKLFFSENVYNIVSPDGTPVYGSFNDYYKKVSYSNVYIYGDILNTVDANGKPNWYRANSNIGNYSFSTLSSEAKAKAIAAGFNPSNYSSICIIFAGPWGGGAAPNLWPQASGSTWIMGERNSGWDLDFGFAGIGVHVHEFAHILGLGDYRPPSQGCSPDYGNGPGGYFLMAYGNYGADIKRHSCPILMSAFEKMKLNYLTPEIISTNKTNYLLPNIEEYNAALKIILNQSGPEEYFLIENKHPIGFDGEIPGGGILITHYASNGNWSQVGKNPIDIEEVGGISPTACGVPGNLYPLDFRCRPQSCWAQYNSQMEADDFMNKPNQVFSPWSSPNSNRLNYTTSSDVAIVYKNKSGSAIYLDLYITNAINAPPSKPQYPRLIGSPKYGWVEVQWDGNLESDVNLYEVSRLIPEYGNSWSVIGTTTNTFFRDTEMLYAPGGGLVTPQYRVRAKDTQNKYSVYSDIVQVRAEPLGKESVLSVEIKDYELATNYPNPFNPSTIIKYAIKEAGLVKLNVYDILGAEVAELVNEVKEVGYHSVEFNAATLPSGVYIYTMQVNGFTSSKKMLLMK